MGRVVKNIRMAALIGMTLLAALAFGDFLVRDSTRMVMTFYTVADGGDLIEERVIKNSGGDMDVRVRRYVDEVLLGPLSHGAAGFFPVETVEACLVSGETASIGLPLSAALSGVDSGDGYVIDAARAVGILEQDLRRNFRQLKNIEIFIDGHQSHPDRESGDGVLAH
jgi:hypothetical protein